MVLKVLYQKLCCQTSIDFFYCQNHSGSVASLRHFVCLPTFLMIELSPDFITQMFFPHDMETLGVSYCFKGIVRCLNIHFTVALTCESGWIYIDDLCVSVRRFLSFQEVCIVIRMAGFLPYFKSLSL